MVTLLVAVVRQGTRDHLLLRDVLEMQEFIVVFRRCVVEAIACGTTSLREKARPIRER